MAQFAPQSLSFLDIAEQDGRFVGVTEGMVVVTDGEMILSVESVADDVSLAAIAAGSTGFIAVGCVESEGTGVIMASATGRYWHEVFRGPRCLKGAEWGNEQWLAVGERTVVVGGWNFEQWIQVPVGTLDRDSLSAAVWTGEQWVAVGRGGTASQSSYG